MKKNPTTQEILAANFARLRSVAGLSQTEVAKRATQHRIPKSASKSDDEFNQRTIGRLEKPDGNPTIETIEAVAAVFSKSPWQLMLPDNITTLPGLPSKLQQILELSRRFNDDGLTFLLEQAEFAASKQKYLKVSSKQLA